MTLEELVERYVAGEGVGKLTVDERAALQLLRDALRAEGWRVVKMEDHGTKWNQDLKVAEELT